MDDDSGEVQVQQSLTSHSTHYRSFRRRFHGSYDPTNSVISLKDDGSSTTSRANPTTLSSLKRKEKDVRKKISIGLYIAAWRLKVRRRLEDRELNQARSKPDTFDRFVRTACICAPLKQYRTLQHRDSFPPDEHHISDVAKWRQTGLGCCMTHGLASQ